MNKTPQAEPRRAIISVQLDAPLAAAIELMQQHDIRHLPVLDDKELVGIVSERDLTVVQSLVPDELSSVGVAEAMTPEPHTALLSTPLVEVAQAMAEHKYGCVIVVDGSGELLDIFTTSDAMRLLMQAAAGRTLGEALRQRPPRE